MSRHLHAIVRSALVALVLVGLSPGADHAGATGRAAGPADVRDHEGRGHGPRLRVPHANC